MSTGPQRNDRGIDNVSSSEDRIEDSSANSNDAAMPQRSIGPYRLIEEIGHGGMGSVWLADQKSPVTRRVALKIIKPGRTDKQVLARFEAERQALSMMDHPNVARVLDAGETADGSPFFVMELVQGDPITKYCDRLRLPPRERLELFIPICSAIQHAHQKGIIHRDIKPSNVLVHVVGGKPIPKVIDFGLAKALQHQTKLTDKTIFTEFGQIVGTVQYMSPEQARTDAVDVDTRSDIYSLGVMLYELLAGSTPIDEETMQSNAVLQLLEIIRDKEPPRPSHRLSTSSATISTISERRQVTPSNLKQMLQGDLDWIIMKSLEKDRTRRYSTPNDLADDVRRYLRGEMVRARPPSASYRLRKFVRKHRALVAAISTFSILVVAGVTGTAAFAVKADFSRRRAEVARNEAEFAAKRSNDVLKIVTDAFESVNPEKGADSTMSARDVLLEAKNSLDQSELDDEGRIELLMRLRTCFFSLGEFEHAVEVGEESLRLKKRLFGETDTRTLTAMNNLAISYRQAGDLDKAMPLLERTLELRESDEDGDEQDVLSSMANLAMGYSAEGKYQKAISLYEQVFPRQKAVLGASHNDTIATMQNLAAAYYRASKAEKALNLLEEVLPICEETFGEDHPTTLRVMASLSVTYWEFDRREEGLKLSEKVLRLRTLKLGVDHPKTLKAMSNLAADYADLGRSEEALELRKKALKMLKQKLDDDHPDVIQAKSALANSYEKIGRIEEAVSLVEEAVESCIRQRGPSHPLTLQNKIVLAGLYEIANRIGDSIELYESTIELMDGTIGSEHRMTLSAKGNLAYTYQVAGKIQSAMRLTEEVLELRKKVFGETHSSLIFTMNNLASIYESLDRNVDAIGIYDQAVSLAKQKLGSDHPATLTLASNRAVSLQELGRMEEAIEVLSSCYEIRKAKLGEFDETTLKSLQALTVAYHDVGQLEKALELSELHIEQMRRHFPSKWNTFASESRCGEILFDLGEIERSEKLLLKSYNALVRVKETMRPIDQQKFVPDAIRRLIRLAESQNDAPELEKWRAELDAWESE